MTNWNAMCRTSLPIAQYPPGAAGGGGGGLVPSGVTPGTYGDSYYYPVFTVDVNGIITSAGELPLPSPGASVSITANPPLTVTPDPITGTGVIDHDNSGATPGSYGDSGHYVTFTIDAMGHITVIGATAWYISPNDGLTRGQALDMFNLPTVL